MPAPSATVVTKGKRAFAQLWPLILAKDVEECCRISYRKKWTFFILQVLGDESFCSNYSRVYL